MKMQPGKGIKSSSKSTTSRTQKDTGVTPEKKMIGEEEGDDNDIEATPNKSAKVFAKNKDEDEDDDLIEDAETWEKPQEDDDDNWDPDFDEFDVPKSGGKSIGGLKKGVKDEDDDFKVDDEFKDMFGGSGFDDKDDDDDY